ncbi:MAG: ATP-binding protein [Nocardiopsaceae bacterium]|nr:ATP-binding protein [Nocardiopsaceae bacterium]
MREFLGEALRTGGLCDECVFKILLAASEACTNAVDHGAPAPDYEVVARVDEHSCVLEIAHKGQEFTGAGVPLPELEAESGRGILLMRQLMEDVAFTGAEEGNTIVRLCKRLHENEPPENGRGTSPTVVLC